MSKRPKGEICIYCVNRPGVTWDHVVARSFFLVKRRGDLPKVPACAECNGEKSKLENYLAAVLPFGGRHAEATENLESMVPGRLAKNAKLHRHLARQRSRAATKTSSGLYVPTIAVPFDGEKFEALIVFIVRGLAWHHWSVLLDPAQCFVHVHSLTAHGERLFANFLRMRAKERVNGNLGDGTFVYRGIQGVDNPVVSVWEFSFYGGATMIGDPDGSQQELSTVGVMTGPLRVAQSADRRAKWLSGRGAAE